MRDEGSHGILAQYNTNLNRCPVSSRAVGTLRELAGGGSGPIRHAPSLAGISHPMSPVPLGETSSPSRSLRTCAKMYSVQNSLLIC